MTLAGTGVLSRCLMRVTHVGVVVGESVYPFNITLLGLAVSIQR
jgi:hypothetical protein